MSEELFVGKDSRGRQPAYLDISGLRSSVLAVSRQQFTLVVEQELETIEPTQARIPQRPGDALVVADRQRG